MSTESVYKQNASELDEFAQSSVCEINADILQTYCICVLYANVQSRGVRLPPRVQAVRLVAAQPAGRASRVGSRALPLPDGRERRARRGASRAAGGALAGARGARNQPLLAAARHRTHQLHWLSRPHERRAVAARASRAPGAAAGTHFMNCHSIHSMPSFALILCTVYTTHTSTCAVCTVLYTLSCVDYVANTRLIFSATWRIN